jgi:hypothetical protein
MEIGNVKKRFIFFRFSILTLEKRSEMPYLFFANLRLEKDI